MKSEFEDKVVVVTGGSRGLGYQMVTGFAREGADVVVASRRIETCEEVAEEIRSTTGRRALPLACHVGQWDSLDGFVDRVYDEFGRVDVLVNNAGMAPLYDTLTDVTEALFDKVIDVNLKGPFRLSALIGERMADGDGGAIINISSFAATGPSPNDIPYAAAKAGLESLTKGLAGVYGPKVRTNAVAVGPFLTDIAKSWDVEGFQAWAQERYPLQRLGEPEEIFGTVRYLASEAASFTTGAIVPVDGGVGVSSPFPL